jgi:hypothetical protein
MPTNKPRSGPGNGTHGDDRPGCAKSRREIEGTVMAKGPTPSPRRSEAMMPTNPVIPIPRKRGRPLGSRNKPKPAEAQVPIRPAALRVARAANYLDVSVSTMRRWVRRGVVEYTVIDNLILIWVSSLDALRGRRI